MAATGRACNGGRTAIVKLAYSTNAYRRFSVTDAIERIDNLGYTAVEIMADAPHAWPATTTERQINAIRTRIEERGMAVSNVNAFMMTAVGDFWHPSWIEPDPELRRLRVQHTLDALGLARKLGAPSISTEPGGPIPPGLDREKALDRFVKGLAETLPRAEEHGVMLLVEPEPGLLIENAAQFLQLAERVDSPMFGLNFDVGHFYCVGEPLPECVARLCEFACHYHVEDIASSRVHEHLVPGRGAIDFAALFRAMARTGYRGWLTVELYPYLDDPDDAGRQARDYLLPLVSS